MFTLASSHTRCLRPLARPLARSQRLGWSDLPAHVRPVTALSRFNRIAEEDPEWSGKKVHSRELLDRLREQEMLRKFRKDDKWEYLAEAYDTLALVHPEKQKLTLGEIEEALPRGNSIAWGVIADVLNGTPSRMTEEEAAAAQFMRIYSVGRTGAARLAKAGLRSLEDFAEWPKATASQKLSLQRLPDMDKMIPRREMDAFKARLGDIFETRFEDAPEVSFEIMGPYRCGLEYSPDINVLVYSDAYTDMNAKTNILDHAYQRIVSKKLIAKDEMLSVSKRSDRRLISGYTRANSRSPWRLLSLKLVPLDQVPFVLVQETGDGFLWRLLRASAKRNGFRFHKNHVERAAGSAPAEEADALGSTAERPPQPKMEKDLFDVAKLPYLEPHQRTYSVYRNLLPANVLESAPAPWDNTFLKTKLRE